MNDGIHYFRAVKNAVKALLQKIFGYRRYLRLFAWFKVKTLHNDKREKDFFVFLSMLPADGIVLDIGANLGFLAAHISEKVSKGKVIAFEPMPDNLDALSFVIRKFNLKNVEVQACALGDADGEAEMVLPVEGAARQQGLSHIVHSDLKDHNEGIRFKVPLKQLDSIPELFAEGVKVTGIKMDVENFEQFVFRGAQKLLKLHRPLVYVELWDNENRNICFSLLQDAGYRICINENGNLTPFDAARHRERINFLVVPA
jgi:FkbM family methyltransferase